MSDASPERKGCKPWVCLERKNLDLSVIAEFFTEDEATKFALETASSGFLDSFYFVARIESLVVRPSLLPGSVVCMKARMLEEIYLKAFCEKDGTK